MIAYQNLYLALAVVLFTIGAIGAITRKNGRCFHGYVHYGGGGS